MIVTIDLIKDMEVRNLELTSLDRIASQLEGTFKKLNAKPEMVDMIIGRLTETGFTIYELEQMGCRIEEVTFLFDLDYSRVSGSKHPMCLHAGRFGITYECYDEMFHYQGSFSESQLDFLFLFALSTGQQYSVDDSSEVCRVTLEAIMADRFL